MSRARRLRSSRIAFLEPAALDGAAVMQRERCLPRDRFDEDPAPPSCAVTIRNGLGRQFHPPERAIAEHERRDEHSVQVGFALERTQFGGQAFVVRRVLDRRIPSRLEPVQVTP